MAEPKKRAATKSRAATTKPRTAKKRKTATPKRRAATKVVPSLSSILTDLKVEDAVRNDLEKLADRDRELATSSLAANALQLAREMDSKSSATSKSMCARALNETMEKLLALAPVEQLPDMLDELTMRRQARRQKVVAS